MQQVLLPDLPLHDALNLGFTLIRLNSKIPDIIDSLIKEEASLINKKKYEDVVHTRSRDHKTMVTVSVLPSLKPLFTKKM